MMEIPFTKMEGCGNDYVFLAEEPGTPLPAADFAELSRRLAPRHTGIGSDGLIVVRSRGADSAMDMWNADGSPGALCVNGLRCAALLAVRRDPSRPLAFSMETGSGAVPVEVSNREVEATVRVRLRVPVVGETFTYDLEGESWTGVRVDAGNPHCVAWMSSPAALKSAPLARWGTAIQGHSHFPGGVNLHLVWGEGPRVIVRHWERGSGATLACGSGALAVWSVARHRGWGDGPLEVAMPGGSVEVWPVEDGVHLEGPAREVYRGVWRG